MQMRPPACASADHLPVAKDECSGAWISDPHYDCCKPLWIVLRVTDTQRNLLEIQQATEIYGRYNVAKKNS